MLWENVLRIHWLTQVFRKAVTTISILILLAAAIGVVVYAKNQVANSPPTAGRAKP